MREYDPEADTSDAKSVEQYVVEICDQLGQKKFIGEISDLLDKVFASLPAAATPTDENYITAHGQLKHKLSDILVTLLDKPEHWLDDERRATAGFNKLKLEVQQTKKIMHVAIELCEFMNKRGLNWRIADFGIMHCGPYVAIFTTKEKWTLDYSPDGDMMVGSDMMRPQPVPDISTVFINPYIYGLYQLHLLPVAERDKMAYLFWGKQPLY